MPPLTESPFGAEVPLLSVIEKAKALLEQEEVSYRSDSRRNSARRELRLALADFKTGEIQIVPALEEGKNFTISDPKIRYQRAWPNGFNSSIEILEPANTGVVALLYPLDPQRQRFLRQDAIIYTPYSSALLQTELVEAGKIYLLAKIGQARQDLSHVSSKSTPGESLGNNSIFSDLDYLNLILSEQMDPGRFRTIAAGNTEFTEEQEKQLVRLTERILVIIGANQEDAYSFTGNYASARGIAQFTPTGMNVVWQNYPEAKIPRDFQEATSNHGNAIKAEICLLDFYLAGLFSCYPDLRGSGFEKYASGACYNGGPGRVSFGLQNFGVSWLNPLLRLKELSQKETLNRREREEYRWLQRHRSHETYVYLNKLHAIELFKERLAAREVPSPIPVKDGTAGESLDQ